MRGVKNPIETRRQWSLTKLLTWTSLLVLSMKLFVSPNAISVDAISFSSSSRPLPSFAPTLLVGKPRQNDEAAPTTTTTDHPSSAPTSSSRPGSKKTKKHKKEKSTTRRKASPQSTRPVTKHKPKKRTSADRGFNTPATAFAGKGRERKKPDSADGDSEPKKKRQKSRTRSKPKTVTKQTAFVREKSIRKRKQKTAGASTSDSDTSDESATPNAEKQEIRQISAKSTKRKSRRGAKRGKTGRGTTPKTPNNVIPETKQIAAKPTPAITKSSKARRRRHKNKILPGKEKINMEGSPVKKKKNQKKEKQRSKRVGGEATRAIEDTQNRRSTKQRKSALDPALGAESPKSSKGSKRKRKKKIASPVVVGEKDTVSSIGDSSKDTAATVETSGDTDAVEATVETIPVVSPKDSERKKKKKGHKKSPSKPVEEKSSSSVDRDESISAVTISTAPLPLTGEARTAETEKEEGFERKNTTITETDDKPATESPIDSVDSNEDEVDSIDAKETSTETTTQTFDETASYAVVLEDENESIDAIEASSNAQNLTEAENVTVEPTEGGTNTISIPSENQGEEEENPEESIPEDKGTAEENTDSDTTSRVTTENEATATPADEDMESDDEPSAQTKEEIVDDSSITNGENRDVTEDEKEKTEIVEQGSIQLDGEAVEKAVNDESKDLEEVEVEIVGEDSNKDDTEVAADDSIVQEKTDDEEANDTTVAEQEDSVKADAEVVESEAISDEKFDSDDREDRNGNIDDVSEITDATSVKVDAEVDDHESASVENTVEEEAGDVTEPEETGGDITDPNSVESDVESAVDESVSEGKTVNGKSDDVTEHEEEGADSVEDDSSKVDADAIDENYVTEGDAESEETTEDETDESGDENNPLTSDNEIQAHRGVTGNDGPGEAKPNSKISGIDPEQDVVSFIEEVLQENVRSWIEDTDSHLENIVNKTRGGHSDDASIIDGQEATSADDATEASATADDECEANPDGLTEPTKECPEILDRDSLEKLEDKDSDAVVSVVTWNLAEDSPSEEDAAFIRKFRKNGVLPGEGSDLVLISGQECENIKPRRSEGRRSREYRRLMIKMLGKGYVPLALHLLGGIQFGLFAKRSFLKQIEDVHVADVTCGIGNVLHNKGAIAAFVKVRARNRKAGDDNDDEKGKKRSKSLRMVFVSAHLAAHVKKADARDADFWRISSELEAQVPEHFLPRKTSNHDDSSSSFLFDSVDRVFFCGDLNYRVDLPRELTEHTILHEAENDKAAIKDLLTHDQLIHSMAEGKAFPGFGEGKITFMPTFKYDKESSSYDTSHKQRIPAWTDRVLFQPASGIRVLDYQSVPGAQSSDHRPVYGTYRIGMEGRVISPSLRKRKRKQISKSVDRSYY